MARIQISEWFGIVLIGSEWITIRNFHQGRAHYRCKLKRPEKVCLVLARVEKIGNDVVLWSKKKSWIARTNSKWSFIRLGARKILVLLRLNVLLFHYSTIARLHSSAYMKLLFSICPHKKENSSWLKTKNEKTRGKKIHGEELFELERTSNIYPLGISLHFSFDDFTANGVSNWKFFLFKLFVYFLDF